ncbi:hypothetical protein HHK36_004835 [Tetracentron sinense]|uniref:Uncharacterized protein n=1 Tax=Tetracentron sinense TaxID=13715 RepID=A0A835DM86_TETSI|nr:hypothetical protein HHK36_004835 [Tetracentron sinense]
MSGCTSQSGISLTEGGMYNFINLSMRLDISLIQSFITTIKISNLEEIIKGLYEVIERLILDLDLQDKIITELTMYRNAKGLFG